MLTDDLQSLKLCSLTCKAIFASARRIIHRRMYLTSDKNWELLTVPERQRYIRGERNGIAVRVLSAIAAQGLLPYARHLFISLNKNFTPANLQPFNHHFQCFDKVQELSIYWLDTPGFLENFDTYFANFVPTLRTLHLDSPAGDTRDILDFVCRFPHLEDLTFKVPPESSYGWTTWKSGPLPVVKSVPPLRGRLKLGGIAGWRGCLLLQLFSLPGKRRFRFIDFRGCNPEVEQPIIDACSDTIETISTTWNKICKLIFSLAQQPSKGALDEKGLPLNLVDATNLRSLTLRVTLEPMRSPYETLFRTISTITSPFFSEFVLEVEDVPGTLEPAHGAWKWWETWTELDEMFERIDIERGFRVVIRAELVHMGSNFTAQAENRLPLMAARKAIIFETGRFPEK